MLIEAPYTNGDTVSIKLNSGEEVIARLEEDKGETVILRKPLMVAATQQGLGLAPFMFTVSPDAKITMARSNILCIVKTDSEMSKQYIQNTTGIQPVTTN
jgi:hypothetical protein